MPSLSVLLTLCAGYAAVTAADFTFLAWKWREADNGLRPIYVAALWPVVMPLLGAYYLAVICYSTAIVLNARRLGRAALLHGR